MLAAGAGRVGCFLFFVLLASAKDIYWNGFISASAFTGAKFAS